MKPHHPYGTLRRKASPLLIVCGALAIAASPARGGVVMPDFHLFDVNSTSSTFNQLVSPRDYLGQVSAYYFGHAT